MSTNSQYTAIKSSRKYNRVVTPNALSPSHKACARSIAPRTDKTKASTYKTFCSVINFTVLLIYIKSANPLPNSYPLLSTYHKNPTHLLVESTHISNHDAKLQPQAAPGGMFLSSQGSRFLVVGVVVSVFGI